jgi:hypothetical protein
LFILIFIIISLLSFILFIFISLSPPSMPLSLFEILSLSHLLKYDIYNHNIMFSPHLTRLLFLIASE